MNRNKIEHKKLKHTTKWLKYKNKNEFKLLINNKQL